METRLKTRTIALLLIFIVLGLYYPAIFAPLNAMDDPGMRDGLLNTDTFSFCDVFFPGGTGTYYRPLLLLSFIWDKYAWGLEESFMHLDNIVLHLCNTLLVFAIARRVSRRLGVESPLPSLLAPLLFAIHPINTESVNWISGRTDLLAGFFILLSAFLLLGRSRNFFTSMCSALCLLLACLAKDTAIFFLPAALILPFYIPGESGNKEPLRAIIVKEMPHFLVFSLTGAFYFAFRVLAFSHGDMGMKQVATHVAGGEGLGVVISLRLVLKAAGFYVKKLFVPFPLNLATIHVSDLYIIVGVLFFALIAMLLARRNLSGFFFILAAAVGASALLVPLLRMTWTPLAERYMYIPSAFFVVGLTFAAYQWKQRKRWQKVMPPVIVSVVAVALVGTAQRNLLWQDNLALLRDCLQKSPGFAPVQNELANALYAEGDDHQAIAIIKSMNLPEDLNNAQFGMISKSVALIKEGDSDGADKILRQALTNPGRHEVKIIQNLLRLHDVQVMKGKARPEKFYRENVRLLTRIYELTLDPFYLYRLGQAHMSHGDHAQARAAFSRVVALAPENAYYRPAAAKLAAKL